MKLDTAVLQALAPADDLSPATAAEAWLFACDARWMAVRAARDAQHEPVAIYELHPGSFRHASPPKPRGPPCNA